VYIPSSGNTIYAGTGGTGGRSVRTVSRGILVPGQTLTIIVGTRGSPGANASNTNSNIQQHGAGYGNNGAVYISWA